MNTTSTGRISLLNAASILCLSLQLSACGGGGGSDDSPETTNLTVTFTNISEPSQLEGISVVLHGADNRSIEQVLEPDNNGVVDFGRIDRSRVSFSVIEDTGEVEEGGYGTNFYINTMLDAPNMPYFFYARRGNRNSQGYDIYYLEHCNDAVQVQGRITNMPESIDSIWIEGMAMPLYFDSPPQGFDAEDIPAENEVFPFYVCPLAFGVDNFYLVAQVFRDFSSDSDLIAHSPRVYLDAETNIYEFDLSQRPFTIPFTNTTGSELYVNSTMNDLPERAIGNGHSSGSDPSDSITMLDLSGEHYVFYAFSWGLGDYFSITRFLNQRPSSLIFNPPAFSLENGIQLNEETRTLSWSLQNSSSVDFTTIYLSPSFLGPSWTIQVNPSTSSMTLPDLSEYLGINLSRDYLSNANMTIGDYSNVSGFDNYLEAFNDLNRKENWFDADYMSLGEQVTIQANPSPAL